MTCQIEYKKYKIVYIKFGAQLIVISVPACQLCTFGWNNVIQISIKIFVTFGRKYSYTNLCQMNRTSSYFYCIKEINLYAEDISSKPYHYRFYTKQNSKETLSKKTRIMCYIECECKHGIIIRTRITCKKIPCYMRDSACRWFIVKKPKIFQSYVKHF